MDTRFCFFFFGLVSWQGYICLGFVISNGFASRAGLEWVYTAVNMYCMLQKAGIGE